MALAQRSVHPAVAAAQDCESGCRGARCGRWPWRFATASRFQRSPGTCTTISARLQQASRSAPGDLSWMGYGDEPWLLTLVSPTSFAAPVIMAVSSRTNRPRGSHASRRARSGRRAARRWFRRSSRGVAGRPLRRSACGAWRAVRLDSGCRAGSRPARRLSAAARRASRNGNSGDALAFRRQRLS